MDNLLPVVLITQSFGYGAQASVGVLRYARQTGRWNVRRCANPNDLSVVAAERPAGIVAQIASERILKIIQDLGVPFVNISGVLRCSAHKVGLDNIAVGRLAADHLLDRGYNRLLCLMSPSLRYAQERADGFRAVAEARGASCTLCNFPSVLGAATDQAAVEESFAQYLRTLESPVGIFAGMLWNEITIGSVANKAGKRIPEDIGIVVVGDDTMRCEIDDPPLSSVDYPGMQIGYEAAKRLDALIENGSEPVREVLLPPMGVTERASTNTWVFADPDVRTVLAFIRANARKDITISQIASRVAQGERSLQRKFREVVGRTMQEELVRTRLELARQLLLETDYSLEAVGRYAGLGNASALCHAFQRNLGLTPKEFRGKFRAVPDRAPQ